MAQSLSCKYRSTFSNSAQDLSAATTAPSVSRTTADHQQCPAGPWDLIIKIASAKGWRNQRRAFAYNASNIEGVCVFSYAASTLVKSSKGAVFEVVVATGVTAKGHGFDHLLFLTNSRNVAQVFKKEKATGWLDSIILVDLNSLKLLGLNCNVFCVPPLVVNAIRYVAKKETILPVNTT